MASADTQLDRSGRKSFISWAETSASARQTTTKTRVCGCLQKNDC
jgi:hypothetical protein